MTHAEFLERKLTELQVIAWILAAIVLAQLIVIGVHVIRHHTP
jgi:hypothetical protein